MGNGNYRKIGGDDLFPWVKRHWFSRRHETAESHNAAVAAHPYTGGRKARKARAEARDGNS